MQKLEHMLLDLRYRSVERAWPDYERGDKHAVEYVDRAFAVQDWERKLRSTVYGRLFLRLVSNKDMTTEEIGGAVRFHARVRFEAVAALLACFAPWKRRRRK